jgi:hypothetical protein
MAEGWVQKRFQQRQARLAQEKLQQQWQANAAASYNSMFDAMMNQVRADVTEYNRLFGEIDSCKVEFSQRPDGFTVDRAEERLTVTKNHGSTIINIERTRNWIGSGTMPDFGSIEVAPDAKGNIRLKKGDKFFTDMTDVSEFILGTLICE